MRGNTKSFFARCIVVLVTRNSSQPQKSCSYHLGDESRRLMQSENVCVTFLENEPIAESGELIHVATRLTLVKFHVHVVFFVSNAG